jgi:long-chain acyl-CoA synthetase
MNVLITGASGFLGSAVLARVALDKQYEKIFVLLRGNSRQTPAARLRDVAAKIFPPEQIEQVLGKLQAVAGDLTLPHLGLSPRDRWEMVGNLNQILHVGASTDFGAPLGESRKYNVEGTRYALELGAACARSGQFQRFDYVSTAYVAGDKAGTVDEDTLTRSQAFANNYEQSKYEAEMLVREYAREMPVVIYRPSIVVGDSQNGYTPHFKVLYWPLKLLAKDLIPFVPCGRRVRLDVVPVDFVADGIVAMMRDPEAVGRTFHLTAGKGNEITVKGLLKDAAAHAGIKGKPLIPFWAFRLIRATPLRNAYPEEIWSALELAKPYAAYLRGTDVRFDARATHEFLLTRHGIRAPMWVNYGPQVLSFCRDSRWGKRLGAPEHAYFASARAQSF